MERISRFNLVYTQYEAKWYLLVISKGISLPFPAGSLFFSFSHPWLEFSFPPRCPQAVWCHWDLSHFLPRWLRTGWKSVISQGKIPWNTPPWLGIEPRPLGEQTVSYSTELSWLTLFVNTTPQGALSICFALLCKSLSVTVNGDGVLNCTFHSRL